MSSVFNRTGPTANPYLLILLALHVALTAYTAKGHFTDSHLYYWQTESVVEQGGFALSNGYEETGSPALRLEGMVAHRGELFSKYPAIHALIAAPFLFLFGEPGLFYLNSLALVGAVWLVLRLTKLVFDEERVGRLSLGLLLGGMYFWYYSQAIWPHMLQVSLILSATYLLLVAYRKDDAWPLGVAGAGALLGLAVGVRLDSLYAVPAMAVLCLVRTAPVRRTLCLLLGMTPFLVLLSYINQAKFGQFTPFSYGPSFGTPEQLVAASPYPAVTVPVVLLCTAFLVREGSFERVLSDGWRRRVFLVLTGLTVAALAYVGAPLLRGIGILLLDMRLLESTVHETGMVRTASDAVIYAGHFKKALLQSVPFLPLVLLPLLKGRSGVGEGNPVLSRWLYLIPGSYLIVFCGLRWHGGMAFDMRYLMPALPFLAILAAGTLHPMVLALDLGSIVRTWSFRVAATALALLFVLAVRQGALPLRLREALFLTLPLVLGVGVFLMVAPAWFGRRSLSARTAGLLCLPLLWGGPVAMADYAQQNAWRGVSEAVASRFAPHIPDGSLVLGLQKDLLSKTENVHFASLREETLEHLPGLVRRYREEGRSVFLLQDRSDSRLEDVGLSTEEFRLDLVEPYEADEGAAAGGLFRLSDVRAGPER